MRFMMLVKATKESEAGVLPSAEMLSAMGKYNEELAKAGVLLDLSGLRSSAFGAKIAFSGGDRTVVEGPFTGSNDIIAGYWLLQTKTKDEAISWVKRAPFVAGEVELRQVFELAES